MNHIVVFNIVLAAVCLFAFLRGGAPERLTAVLFVVAALATFSVPSEDYYTHYVIEPIRLGIDALLALGLIGIALRADRFWPLYISALQIIALGVHGVKAYDPMLVPWMYAAAIGKIAYPMLILLAIGVTRHRDRLRQFGRDLDWSPLARAG